MTDPAAGSDQTHAPRPTQLWRTLAGEAGLDPDLVVDVVQRALAEDLAYGPDVTTAATIPAGQRGTAALVARAPGILAGVPIAVAVAELLGAERGTPVDVDVRRRDGDAVAQGDTVLTVSGAVPTLLTAERTLLNLVGQLSGVATLTARWVRAVAGTDARIRDTRKTVPGLRVLQKYAVRCGGGVNHRMGLGDAALIKDNHVAAAGSVAAAFAAVRRACGEDFPIEVEVDTLDQLREALAAGAETILLDNMAPPALAEAVALARGSDRSVRLEASGGLTLADAPQVAATGVDYLAVGALTHSAPVLDLGLDLS